MSLLSRTSSARHLDDAAFTEIWTAAVTAGQSPNTPSDAHLAACAHCRSRYAAFTSWLDGLREDADAEADEAFPPERLAMQQAQVLRRLEALERPARVLVFPKFHRPTTSTQGHAQRWIAAAAAAGLVIGLAAGQFVDIRNTFGRPTAQPGDLARLQRPMEAAPQATTPIGRSSVSDETLFFGPDPTPNIVPISSLQPMDAITPLARDVDRPQ